MANNARIILRPMKPIRQIVATLMRMPIPFDQWRGVAGIYTGGLVRNAGN